MVSRKSSVDLSEVFAGLDSLQSAREPIARAMGSAMGNSVRDEAKIRAPVLQPGNAGTDSQRPGLLRDSIYNALDKRRLVLNPSVFRYTVSWNSTKAPHGHLVEFGHEMPYFAFKGGGGLWFTPGVDTADGRAFYTRDTPYQVAAQPFLAPAFDAKLPTLLATAIGAGERKYSEVVNGN